MTVRRATERTAVVVAGGGGGGTFTNGGGGGWQGGGGYGIVRAPAVEIPTVLTTTSVTQAGGFRATAIGSQPGNGFVRITYTVVPTAITPSSCCRFTG